VVFLPLPTPAKSILKRYLKKILLFFGSRKDALKILEFNVVFCCQSDENQGFAELKTQK